MFDKLFENLIDEKDESGFTGRIYSHTDADGLSAAAVAFNSPLVGRSKNCEVILIDYGVPINFTGLTSSDTVIITDFSFEIEKIEELLKITQNVIWIDHHISAIEKYREARISLEGIQSSGEWSAVALAWQFFFENEGMPFPVKYISDFDIWKWQYGEKTDWFQAGLMTNELDPKGEFWVKLLFEGENEDLMAKILETGKSIVKWRDEFCSNYLKKNGFEAEFEGLKCIVCNLSGFGSFVFGEKLNKYDAGIVFRFDGKKWEYGIYSSNANVSCADIVTKYGGGGHVGAAGFSADKLLFEKGN